MKKLLLQLNLAGYPLVLPDMIGGNGYNNNKPDKEIFLRWLQANTFMPSLQFSFVPWDYDDEVGGEFVARASESESVGQSTRFTAKSSSQLEIKD